MLQEIIFLVAGLFILIKGADLLVEGAVSLAGRLRISQFLVGLFVVGFGTSIPELAITLTSHLNGSGGLGLGTIVGSNTFNLLFILGLASFISPINLKIRKLDYDLIWNFATVLLVLILILVTSPGVITRTESTVMIFVLLVWIISSFRKRQNDEVALKQKQSFFPFFLIVVGLAGVILGGEWVVDSSFLLAQSIGVSDWFIGLVILGIGTSIPELAVTLTALAKGKNSLAIGNIIGSNIFDFLAILGLAGILKPIFFPIFYNVDLFVTLAAAVLLFVVVKFNKTGVLSRRFGLSFLFIYACYFVFLVWRG